MKHFNKFKHPDIVVIALIIALAFFWCVLQILQHYNVDTLM